jgi:hypothetical protein
VAPNLARNPVPKLSRKFGVISSQQQLPQLPCWQSTFIQECLCQGAWLNRSEACSRSGQAHGGSACVCRKTTLAEPCELKTIIIRCLATFLLTGTHPCKKKHTLPALLQAFAAHIKMVGYNRNLDELFLYGTIHLIFPNAHETLNRFTSKIVYLMHSLHHTKPHSFLHPHGTSTSQLQIFPRTP